MFEPDANQIIAPRKVASPPTFSHCGNDMMLTPSGQLRHYGISGSLNEQGKMVGGRVVITSDDLGLNWRLSAVEDAIPGATVQSPWSGDFITTLRIERNTHLAWQYRMLPKACEGLEQGLWVFRAPTPDGPFTHFKLAAALPGDTFFRLPMALKKRRRWILPFQQHLPQSRCIWGIFYSDDDGNNWIRVAAPNPPALEKVRPPHKGLRWLQPGQEAAIIEHDDGTLHALLRTSMDFHYQSFSTDGGETWSEPEPSRFPGTATQPNWIRLSDGRIVVVWNNTAPLPEMDHRLQGLEQWEIDGLGEDMFTNRDVLHAAISDDDGKTFHGFREIALNEARNDASFRGGTYPWMFDRSVQMTQILELPNGKIIVAYGQNLGSGGILIFDPSFLYETSRIERFDHGLNHWSNHQYIKSQYGGFRGISGHCNYNRRPGALLMPHPDRQDREVLLIGVHPDARLEYPREGAVWNFTAAVKGHLIIRMFLARGSDGIRISLADRWFNPVDSQVAEAAIFSIGVNRMGNIGAEDHLVTPGCWQTLEIEWDCTKQKCSVFCNGRQVNLEALNSAPNAISYLHLQSLEERDDPFGVMIEECSFEALKLL